MRDPQPRGKSLKGGWGRSAFTLTLLQQAKCPYGLTFAMSDARVTPVSCRDARVTPVSCRSECFASVSPLHCHAGLRTSQLTGPNVHLWTAWPFCTVSRTLSRAQSEGNTHTNLLSIWFIFLFVFIFFCSTRCQEKTIKKAYCIICEGCAKAADACMKCGAEKEIVQRYILFVDQCDIDCDNFPCCRKK